MKNSNRIAAGLLIASFTFAASFSFAEETTVEKVETSLNKGTDKVKKTYRDAKDKTCEMVNGKMKCVGKKIKNKARNAKDKIETTTEELKNKVD
jgi:S-methylmethionine-dependent homocysteine/selenocysteine methylase